MALPQLLRMVQELKGTLVTVMGKLVPSGVILMWSGSTDTIPAGWALCNGQDGTPDLTDRFILGAGKTYQPGTTGGAATVTPSVAARSAHAGIAVQNAALSIWTGAAGTGIGIQGTTLDGNTLPSHAHTSIQPSEYRDNGWGDSGNITFRGPTQKNGGYTGNSWAHAHGVSDPGHAHAVGSSEHKRALKSPGGRIPTPPQTMAAGFGLHRVPVSISPGWNIWMPLI